MKTSDISDILPEIINQTSDSEEFPPLCWCPLCEQPNQKIGSLGFWRLTDFTLICYFALCEECGKTRNNAPRWLRLKLIDKTEENLVWKYPKLLDRLPLNYLATAN